MGVLAKRRRSLNTNHHHEAHHKRVRGSSFDLMDFQQHAFPIRLASRPIATTQNTPTIYSNNALPQQPNYLESTETRTIYEQAVYQNHDRQTGCLFMLEYYRDYGHGDRRDEAPRFFMSLDRANYCAEKLAFGRAFDSRRSDEVRKLMFECGIAGDRKIIRGDGTIAFDFTFVSFDGPSTGSFSCRHYVSVTRVPLSSSLNTSNPGPDLDHDTGRLCVYVLWRFMHQKLSSLPGKEGVGLFGSMTEANEACREEMARLNGMFDLDMKDDSSLRVLGDQRGATRRVVLEVEGFEVQ